VLLVLHPEPLPAEGRRRAVRLLRRQKPARQPGPAAAYTRHGAAHDMRGAYPVREARARPPHGSEEGAGPMARVRMRGGAGEGASVPRHDLGQLEHHRSDMRRCGQGTSKLTIQPHRKNLLRIDYRIL
jgi:hypothetical protein